MDTATYLYKDRTSFIQRGIANVEQGGMTKAVTSASEKVRQKVGT